MSRLIEGSLVVMHNRSYSVTAEIEVPESGADGVVVALGVGCWSLYALNGKLKHWHNFFGIWRVYAEGKQAIPAGKHQVRMEFKYGAGGLAKDGTVSLFVGGKNTERAASTARYRCCSPPTRPATAGRKPARRSHQTTVPQTTTSAARSTGCRSTWTRMIMTPDHSE
jgi:hypothetical protein